MRRRRFRTGSWAADWRCARAYECPHPDRHASELATSFESRILCSTRTKRRLKSRLLQILRGPLRFSAPPCLVTDVVGRRSNYMLAQALSEATVRRSRRDSGNTALAYALEFAIASHDLSKVRA
jgi:hypothetical protein